MFALVTRKMGNYLEVSTHSWVLGWSVVRLNTYWIRISLSGNTVEKIILCENFNATYKIDSHPVISFRGQYYSTHAIIPHAIH